MLIKMADNNNNNQLSQLKKTSLFISGNSEILSKISPKIFETYKKLASERNLRSYEITARSVSGVGENCNGFVLQMCLKAVAAAASATVKQKETENSETTAKPFITILKISPKAPAYRSHGRIVDLYKREVFMYQQVFKEFQLLYQERQRELINSLPANQLNCDDANETNSFDVVPEMFYACLDDQDEFIISEDLTLSDYKQNLRTNMPTYDIVCATFRSIAKMHAMSFILQSRKPELFKSLAREMSDNLFSPDMAIVSVEFGKKYIRRTRTMLEQEAKHSLKQIKALEKLENNFQEIGLKCVDGQAVAPYAVICHGDFWNNNILYKFDGQQRAISAKLIDFQLSRYASPVLDLVHYLFTCTESDLRNKHFMEFMDIYYATLTSNIEYFGHCIEEIYPKTIFLQHLRDFGIYGFCMAAFSIPFFISNANELPDLEEVSRAIKEISSNQNSDDETEIIDEQSCGVSEANHECLELLEEYDLLCERTLPIFKRRMCGITKDLEKYQMIEDISKW